MAHQRYIALYAYDGGEEGNACFSEGDVLAIEPDPDSQWWNGWVLEYADGRPVEEDAGANGGALVPANYVREATDEEDAAFRGSVAAAGVSAKVKARTETETGVDVSAGEDAEAEAEWEKAHSHADYVRARALYDWDGDLTQHILPLVENSIMYVLPDDSAQWWDAKTEDGVIGLVPHNYVELITEVAKTCHNV